MTAYLSLRSIHFDEKPLLADRPDLGVVVIYPTDPGGATQIQVSDVATARAWAQAWAQAADMLEAQAAAKAAGPAGPAGQASDLDAGSPACRARIPAGRYVCTREPGHGGDHEARGARARTEPPLTWPQDGNGTTPEDGWPASYLACGDQQADPQPIEPGTRLLCPRHGETTVITKAEWLARTSPDTVDGRWAARLTTPATAPAAPQFDRMRSAPGATQAGGM